MCHCSQALNWSRRLNWHKYTIDCVLATVQEEVDLYKRAFKHILRQNDWEITKEKCIFSILKKDKIKKRKEVHANQSVNSKLTAKDVGIFWRWSMCSPLRCLSSETRITDAMYRMCRRKSYTSEAVTSAHLVVKALRTK